MIFRVLFFLFVLVGCIHVNGQAKLKITEKETGNHRIIKSKKVKAVIMKDGRVFEQNIGVSSDGMMSAGERLPLEAIHVLEVDQTKFGDVLAAPLRWTGLFLVGTGVVLTTFSIPEEDENGDVSLLAAGLATGASGFGLFMLGRSLEPNYDKAIKSFSSGDYQFMIITD